MTRLHRITLLSLGLLALFSLAAYAQGVRTPLGDFRWTRDQEEKKMTREEAVAKYN